jgi:hypothetical protein
MQILGATPRLGIGDSPEPCDIAFIYATEVIALSI